MQKIVSFRCPKCNNSHSFYRFGKDNHGYQKYLCRNCNHQFTPDNPSSGIPAGYPACPVCGKASFIHHDYEFYTNCRCGDKKCCHSFYAPKPAAIPPASLSSLAGKADFKGMRYPVQTVICALTMFYLGKSSFRNISMILRITNNIKASHTTISNWCKRFAPLFQNLSLELIPRLNFDSDERHADETVVKVLGKKHYIWFIVDSETRFGLGYHLSSYSDSSQAYKLFNSVTSLGNPGSIVSDGLGSYIQPVKAIFNHSDHIRVQSFRDDVSNNLIESFNKQFKAWYTTKQGFNSYESDNNMIYMFVFFFNFVRPHSWTSKAFVECTQKVICIPKR